MKLTATQSKPSEIHRSRLAAPLRALAAILACGAMTAGAQSANVLFNGTLDQTGFTSQANPCPLGWVVESSKAVSGGILDGGDSEPWCNVADPGGFGFFFKPFQGTQPDGDLLTVKLYQDNSATPGTKYTLSGYAAGEANFSGFFTTNSPAPAVLFFVEFLDASGTMITSNTYDLVTHGLPNGGPGSMALLTEPQVTAPAGTATVRAGAAIFNVYSTTGAQSYFADAFDLEAIAPPGSPVITNQPGQVTASAGDTVHFTVGVSNPAGVSYQWQLANTNISNGAEYSGVTTGTLTITGVAAGDVGHYRALVSNSSGSVYSADAPLTLLGVDVNPVLKIVGKVGDTYRVDYTLDLNNPTWTALSTNKLTATTLQVVDPVSATTGKRFYRAIFLY